MSAEYIFFTFFVIFTLGISGLYFYIFAKSQESFVRYLGICWALYSCSLLFLTFGVGTDIGGLLSIRKIFDMFNVLAFLYATYAFSSKKTPSVWLRFSLYISIWSLLGVVFDFDPLSTDLPTVMYQICITLALIYVIFRHWNNRGAEQTIIAVTFFIWGIGKAYISIASDIGALDSVSTYYIAEIMFSNILNFMLLILFFQRTQKRLSAAELTFQTITENATDILFLVEPYGEPEIRYISPSLRTILGIPEVRMYSNSRYYETFIHPDDWKLFDSITSGSNPDDERTATIRAYTAEGRLLWMDVTVKKVLDVEGTLLLEGIARDITATKAAEEQMIQSKLARDKLLSYVSHELKTPIASILGYSTALRDNLNLTEEQKKDMLDVIYTKSITLDKLIYDLVQLSKLETKQYSFEFSLIDCLSVSREFEKRHSRDGEDKGVRLSFNMKESMLREKSVIADLDRIDQVFTNILTNAIRYSQKGQKIVIIFELDRKRQNYLFSITNFGPAILEKDRVHIFDRFYRVDAGQKSANEKNSGLGLTISKEIVEAHNGTINVESSLVRGTTFTVSIPVYDERSY